MQDRVSPDIIEKWLTGWSLSRELPLPVIYRSGFKVDVHHEKQIARYVFAEPNEDFIKVSTIITEPWVFLKVCASPAKVGTVISEKWIVQPQGYMMTCMGPMDIASAGLSHAYNLEFDTYNSTYVVRIVTKNGGLACIGHVVLVNDFAVYDRILTTPNHQRKGLATFLMKELEKIALSKRVFNNLLVATEEGRLLYQSMGWDLYSLYTSFVIPG